MLWFRPGAVRYIRMGPLQGMRFRVNEIIGLSPWHSGSERQYQKVFKKIIRTGDVIIDIGANWGLHALCFSRLVGVSGKVQAIEPYPPAFTELEWHLKANHCSNIIALHSL